MSELESRTRLLNKKKFHRGPVAYWMSRDQRVEDNWALLFAVEQAKKNSQGLLVLFVLDWKFPGANKRHFDFMLKGLREIDERLMDLRIPFIIRVGKPEHVIKDLVNEYQIGLLITDFDPLRIKQLWKWKLVNSLEIPIQEVDAHNIVPCWIASDREEYGAFTLRSKIKKLLPHFLTPYPEVPEQKNHLFNHDKIEWDKLFESLNFSESVDPVTDFIPGSNAAYKTLGKFIQKKLSSYSAFRNDPNAMAGSGLSPYLHFGNISSQRVAIEVLKNTGEDENTRSFLEELIIRKELSDNFCFYNKDYDNISAFKSWAKESLQNHSHDEREFNYSEEELESADTHDSLWNAAQMEMVLKGKMHGYMRMYWAKKILEWTKTPDIALRIAIRLNDKYSLDGRDPNGYTGCAWSIGGIHDRPWKERPVFGMIRYMNYNGCKRKFDVDGYIERIGQIHA